jgi:hypothetical protein
MVCWRIMRTTITLENRLLADLKRRATERGTTVSRLIEDSVRLAISRPKGERNRQDAFELVTYGKGGRFTQLDVDRTSVLLERDDLERYGSRGR